MAALSSPRGTLQTVIINITLVRGRPQQRTIWAAVQSTRLTGEFFNVVSPLSLALSQHAGLRTATEASGFNDHKSSPPWVPTHNAQAASTERKDVNSVDCCIRRTKTV